MALSAYRNAERMMAAAYPGCGVSWNLLAGIGRIESLHANGGATDSRGTAVQPIYGPALDGTLPGNEVIVQSRTANRVMYARAMGPMQFLPGTWSRYASDGDGDGKADVQNVFDASLAAARYLCSGGLNLRDPGQVMSAILRYNNSVAYARNVLGWAAAYATGVVPVDLPPIVGPVPPIGDMHLDNYKGLGPGLPTNALGLPADDPLALMPLMGRGDVASQIPVYPGQSLGPLPGPAPAVVPQQPQPQQPAPPPWLPPWMQPPPQEQPKPAGCAVFCITPTAPAPSALPAAPGDAQMLMPQAATRGSSPRTARTGAGPAAGCRPSHRHRPHRTGAGSCARTGWLRRSSSRPRLGCNVADVPNSHWRFPATPPRAGIGGPRRAGQGDRPRAAAPDHRTRHGQERHRRRRRPACTSRCT